MPGVARHVIQRGNIRLQFQRQHVYGPYRFRLAIEARLGRTTGPKKISQPKKMEAAPPASDVPQKRPLRPLPSQPDPDSEPDPVFLGGTDTNS